LAWAILPYGVQNTLSEAEKELDSFADLEHGWDYGRGGPIHETTLNVAREWLHVLESHPFSNIATFPGSSGKVTIAASSGDHYLEVIVEPDLSISVAYDFRKKQKFFRLHLKAEEAQQSVSEVLGEICSAPISSILENITFTKASLSAMPLRIMEDHYQLWILPAQKRTNRQSANISESPSREWMAYVATPLFFGGSILSPFPPEVT
jgi:hypothetical protein